MFYMIDIGKKIKELRTERGLTQAQACAILHIARNTLSQYETGKALPSLEVLILLAKYFDVTTDYLLGLHDYP